MARGLKIRKVNTDGVNGNQVDYGYPNNGTTNNGYDADYPGIVGGSDEDSNQIQARAVITLKGLGTITTTTSSNQVIGTNTSFGSLTLGSGSIVAVPSTSSATGYLILGKVSSVDAFDTITLQANSAYSVTNSAFVVGANHNVSIIRQKGSRKYLVAYTSNYMNDETIVAGQAYRINSVGTTNWAALGASINAVVGDIFTATVNGTGLTTTGTVNAAGTCILANQDAAALTLGQMSIELYTVAGTVYASRIKDHWSMDFDNLYANANPGNTYIATIFTTSGTPDPATGFTTAGTENWC
jgi:hypothetical protein